MGQKEFVGYFTDPFHQRSGLVFLSFLASRLFAGAIRFFTCADGHVWLDPFFGGRSGRYCYRSMV
ncbi:hypothetical protein D3C86_1710020 [compost metagenome]